MKCPDCGGNMKRLKETCLFCEGTGKQEDGDSCRLCDENQQVSIIWCEDKNCSYYDDPEQED